MNVTNDNKDDIINQHAIVFVFAPALNTTV
jgi:hypothetical protein